MVAYDENASYLSTLLAFADYSADGNDFKAVKINETNGRVELSEADTDDIIGILSNKPDVGQRARVVDLAAGGIVKVRIGASQTITVGMNLMATAAGLFIEATAVKKVSIIALEAITTTTGDNATGIISGKIVSTFVTPA